LSRAAFARRFTALLGSAPLTYLTWWRMTVAARLLRETDLPVGAVAHRVGYASEFAFAGAFKREYGRPVSRQAGGCLSRPPVEVLSVGIGLREKSLIACGDKRSTSSATSGSLLSGSDFIWLAGWCLVLSPIQPRRTQKQVLIPPRRRP
jgi:AraC-like DNA-binding protein